ncbi:hypothetical protein H2248_004156 [Termitomyces sp. 'cryptogamus']|nr:hypothetical protein H2248_004156 [Termitomyces sp. 'cryptogamus']
MTHPLDPCTLSSNLPLPKTPDAPPNFPHPRLTPMPPQLTPMAPWPTLMAPWPTSMPSLQPLTLTLDLPNSENHPHYSQSSPPIINSTPILKGHHAHPVACCHHDQLLYSIQIPPYEEVQVMQTVPHWVVSIKVAHPDVYHTTAIHPPALHSPQEKVQCFMLLECSQSL